jgi:BASS family bile acid:Na+ symporter
MGDFYIANEYWFAVVQLVLAMLGMGATLTLKDFREVLVEPKAVSIGTLIQLALVPLLAYCVIHGLGIVGGMAVALALLSAIPGGTSSNMFTFFARGNTALSITITALTTLACMVTTPLILMLLAREAMPADFTMPTARIALEIGLCLMLPLFLGMLYLIAYPASADRFAKWCIRGSLLGILAIVIGAASAGRLDLQAFGLANTLLITGFIALLALIGWLVTRATGLAQRDGVAISMEMVVRNVNLGLLIKTSLFPAVAGASQPMADMVLFAILLYGTLQLMMGAALIFLAVSRRPQAASPGQ